MPSEREYGAVESWASPLAPVTATRLRSELRTRCLRFDSACPRLCDGFGDAGRSIAPSSRHNHRTMARSGTIASLQGAYKQNRAATESGRRFAIATRRRPRGSNRLGAIPPRLSPGSGSTATAPAYACRNTALEGVRFPSRSPKPSLGPSPASSLLQDIY